MLQTQRCALIYHNALSTLGALEGGELDIIRLSAVIDFYFHGERNLNGHSN